MTNPLNVQLVRCIRRPAFNVLDVSLAPVFSGACQLKRLSNLLDWGSV